MEIYSEQDFLNAIALSFLNYKAHGARSTRKLEPLHEYVADVLRKIWGRDYSISSLEPNNKEKVVEGKYYFKKIDVTVTHNNNPVFCLGIKFITSNYKQNANNYFESMMGETANIQTIPKLKYAHLIIVRKNTPYYKKYDVVNPSKIERLSHLDLIKYLKLMFDSPYPHQPYGLCIFPIDINEKTNEATLVKYESLFDDEDSSEYNKKVYSALFYDYFSPETFFSRIEKYKNYYEISSKK